MKEDNVGSHLGRVAANLGLVIAKWIAAKVTGSSAMFSKSIHSIVDTGIEASSSWV